MKKILPILIEVVLLSLAVARGERQPDIWQIQSAYITTYNWEHGGHNTNSNPDDVSSGLPTTDWLFDVGMACPREWVGNINLHNAATVVVTFPAWTGLGERWCVDTFGEERNQKPVYLNGRWNVRFDIPARVPNDHPLNNDTITGWSAEWRPYWKLLEQYSIN